MREELAPVKADDFIRFMLQYQANLFGSTPLHDLDSAKTAAQSLAAFRAELIEKLKAQP